MTLKVKTLIEQLSKCNPDKDIFINNCSSNKLSFGDEIIEIVDNVTNVHLKTKHNYSNIEHVFSIAQKHCYDNENSTLNTLLKDLLNHHIILYKIHLFFKNGFYDEDETQIKIPLERSESDANLLPEWMNNNVLNYDLSYVNHNDGELCIHLIKHYKI